MSKKPMYQVIYEDVLGKIQSGEYKQGLRLESEDMLAKQYNVSRITSKRALSMLCDKGYIVRKQGQGSFVADNEVNTPDDKAKPETPMKTIGLIIDYVGNSFALNLFNQLSKQSAKAGYNMLISVSHSSQETEMRAIDLMKKSNCDGIILVPVIREFYNLEIIRSIADHYPILTIDRELIGLPAPCVSTDHAASAIELTKHLIERGHTQIAYINSRKNISKSEELRSAGFANAMESHKLRSDLIFTPPGYFSIRMLTYLTDDKFPNKEDMESVTSIASEFNLFLDRNPQITALVCCNHYSALLSWAILNKRKMRVPEDISIVCFDEIERYYRSVYFTHIHQNAEEIAAHAIKTMNSLIDGDMNAGTRGSVLIPGTLVEGNTVRALQ